jgi:CheY-like chemotaxis protein
MPTILVVDDERDIRELVAFSLRFAGIEVLTATDGEEAVLLAAQALPDLILMDVRMPRVDGFEACRRIKASAGIGHIPVVFLSAKGQDAEIQAGFAAGGTDYLVKPFSPLHLAERVRELLASAGAPGSS